MEPSDRPRHPAESGGEVEAWRSGRHTPDPEPPSDRDPLAALKRFRPRSLKGATGLGIVAAAALLFVFLAFDDQARFWVPVAAGFVVLVLLALLRLDRLLKGWTWHVAGLAMLAGLVVETSGNPWAWALAASIGILVAGLLRLPRWRLVAAGTVLVAVSAVGYQFRAAEVRDQEAQVAQQAGNEMRQKLGVTRPALVLVGLERGIRTPDPQALCRLLDPQANQQLLQATAAPTCEAAVAVLHAKIPAGTPEPDAPRATSSEAQPPGTVLTLNGCDSLWGTTVPTLGEVDALRTEAVQESWRVAGFRPCPGATT
jgi:hypothetical protein